ncbi:MAG TPA: efflux transporter outer membrane subunit [Bryobacteraceae bacterium]|nr:efflux transporter outer membrane subunit [Bryobacteraceae bacterium]
MGAKAAMICVAAALTGCTVGPNYKRPSVPVPPQYRDGEPHPSQLSLGDEKWFDLFQDEVLRGLIREALQNNYDIRKAAQRVLEAEGQLAVTRSSLFPHLNGEGDASRVGLVSPIQSGAGLFGVASWEPDLFGKLRRATQAARADLLATEEDRKAVITELVAQVASAYFDLREYDDELEIVRDSIKTRQESVNLVAARVQGGVGSMLDLDQARSLVESAQSDAILLEKAQTQTENLICFLLGRTPGPIARGLTLVDQPQPPSVPSGLPSALLERRPDVLGAEQQLVAANARVGVAKAAFFPSISLTASGGAESSDLVGIAERRGFSYSMLGIVDLPIFDAGRRSGNYKIAKAQREQLLLNYENTINGAFRDVSDALIGHKKSQEYASNQMILAETLRDQTRLANMRYVGGVSSYLEVLDTERQRLTAEQLLARAQRDVLITLVQLYKSLGGGWQ